MKNKGVLFGKSYIPLGKSDTGLKRAWQQAVGDSQTITRASQIAEVRSLENKRVKIPADGSSAKPPKSSDKWTVDTRLQYSAFRNKTFFEDKHCSVACDGIDTGGSDRLHLVMYSILKHLAAWLAPQVYFYN